MRAILCAAGAALLLAGCSWFPSVGVYKLDVNQGNYITQDQVEKLKVGQTRAQVRSALGTPLLADRRLRNSLRVRDAERPDERERDGTRVACAARLLRVDGSIAHLMLKTMFKGLSPRLTPMVISGDVRSFA